MSTQSRKKKVVRWGLIAIVPLIALVVGVILKKVNDLQEKMADIIVSRPQDTAVVTYSVDGEGNIVDDGNAIFHNADEPLVVASVMKIVVLAVYADMVANGELNPAESVSIAEWERYYLPGSDGGAHVLGLRSVGLQADELGFATDQTATVTLDDLATMMMHFSGNAATDFLIERVSVERVTAVTQTHLPSHTPISFTLGYALAVFNHEAPFSSDWLQQVSANINSDDNSDIERLIELYLDDESWRSAQIDFVTGLSRMDTMDRDIWGYQTAAAQLLPKGTARDYAQMMAQIANSNFISPEVSLLMQQKLETVPSDWPLRLLYYDRFGAKDGATAGVLTVASYAVPKRRSLRGQLRIVVLLTNSLPPEQFVEQVQFQGHYLLPINLVQGNGAFAKLHVLNE